MNNKTDLFEMVRFADRVVLEVARTHKLRPMEAYLLLALDEPQSTAYYAKRIAASSSQTKQLALALQRRGFARRIDRTGLTHITSLGREMKIRLRAEINAQICK